MAEYRGLILPDAPQFERKASGFILMDGVETASTLRCVHGGEHFISIKGSGTKRGWCMKCDGVFCGPQHAACCHWEKKIEDFEQSKLSGL